MADQVAPAAVPTPAPTQPVAATAEAVGMTSKRNQILKANSKVVVVTAIAAFVIIFSLFASKTLLSRAMYQSRVAGAKKQTLSLLKTDITTSKTLATSFQTFDAEQLNIIGGSSTGSGPNDGPNSKIVLDALPSSYDFPALTTSLEKLVANRNLTILDIAGTDDQVTQQTNVGSATPTAVAIPFSLSVEGNYTSIQGLITDLETSIRPFQIQTLTVSGDQTGMTLALTAQTYYQPDKDLTITSKVVQ
jgi:hypothetical protein